MCIYQAWCLFDSVCAASVQFSPIRIPDSMAWRMLIRLFQQQYIKGNDSTRIKFNLNFNHLNFNLVESLPLTLWSPDVFYSKK